MQRWIIYHEFNGDRTVTIHELHEKYEPAVRVSAIEISFTNPEGVKEIYGAGSTIPKTICSSTTANGICSRRS
jgi:hypothetical protein